MVTFWLEMYFCSLLKIFPGFKNMLLGIIKQLFYRVVGFFQYGLLVICLLQLFTEMLDIVSVL